MTENDKLLEATCQVALSAFLGDLAGFAERAGLEVDAEGAAMPTPRDARGNDVGGQARDSRKQRDYARLAWGLIEGDLPQSLGGEVFPFTAAGDSGTEDSMVDAAGSHRRPVTSLQWIIATADRVASGFEAEGFETYGDTQDRTEQGGKCYSARQSTLFEQIRIRGGGEPRQAALHYRYPLRPLSPEALFPTPAEECESIDEAATQGEYRRLWEGFTASLQRIPSNHRGNWPLWLDHFDSAWACYTQAIPATTVVDGGTDTSLYDHSRTTAALAAALWRYHHERGDGPRVSGERLSTPGRSDWTEEKLLLIQGDFFGIQDFIFAAGGETQRRAAKLLRGRSFYVSLLTECAALCILERLALPPTSQVVNAAGKFLIVAPNSPRTVQALEDIQGEFDTWCLEHAYGQSGIGIAWLPASCNDFLRRDKDAPAPFRALVRRLFEALQEVKTRRFGLCGEQAPEPVFDGFLDHFRDDRGVCAIDGHSPASVPLEDSGRYISPLARDQIAVGQYLTRQQRVLITRRPLAHNSLGLPLFGYHVQFSGSEAQSGPFGIAAQTGDLCRAWDFSLPTEADIPLFNGYARRHINGYVPLQGEQNAWEAGRYGHLEADAGPWHPLDPKTLEHIACDDRWPDTHGHYRGSEALITLKGDVDNLGLIFEQGLAQPSFAKMAALSRQLNAFFAIWLPWRCRESWPGTYTVFAGGDDFFLIGPWRSTLGLAGEMQREFARYVAHNPDIHFSAGLSMTKAGLPVRQMGDLAERALEDAKDRHDPATGVEKNAVTVFRHTVGWEEFHRLWRIQEDIEQFRGELALSTGYLFGLQALANMAEDLKRAEHRPDHSPDLESALWNARFAYRTRRLLEAQRHMSEAERRRWQQRLGELLANGIGRYGSAFEIPLFIHLYHHRH